MADLHIDLLGGFEVRRDGGAPIEIEGRKARALLAFLAHRPDRRVPREQLCGLLWGDRGEAQARGSLRQTLTALRRSLAGADGRAPLATNRESVWLDGAAVAIDLRDFEQGLRSGTPESLEQSVRLYRGGFLDGTELREPGFMDWIDGERRRLHEAAARACRTLIGHLERDGATRRGIEAAERLVGLDACDEEGHRALMRLHTTAGSVSAALRQYETCRETLRRELGIAPSAETGRLLQEIRGAQARARRDAPPAPDGAGPSADSPGGPVATIPTGPPLPGLPAHGLSTPSVPAPVVPDRPALAVLPFANLSGDPEQDYFADGVVEDIITALSRFRSFTVIARNSSFTYKGRTVDVRQAAAELGVRYVLEGSVRRAGGRLRISAQLVDGATAAHLWADRYDGPIEDVFDVQDRITEAVAAIVEPRIREAAIESSRRERPGSIAAYDLFLRALPLHRAGTQTENVAAYELFSQAIALEPNNSLMLAWTLDTLLHRTIMGWPPLTTDDRGAVRDYVHRALAHAGDDAAVLGRCGNALIQVIREHERGLATLQRAVQANPNSVEVMTFAGIGHLHCGSVDDALAYFRGALRLSPADPYAFVMLTGIAHAHMIRGAYAEALGAAEQSLAVNAGFDPTYWMLISSSAWLGRMAEARRHAEAYQALTPGITLARIRAAQPPDPARMGAILEGLRTAGLPEG